MDLAKHFLLVSKFLFGKEVSLLAYEKQEKPHSGQVVCLDVRLIEI